MKKKTSYDKYYLILFLLLGIAILGKSQTAFKPHKSDTTRTVALYMSLSGGIYLDQVVRVTVDTFVMKSVDSVTMKKQWMRDTLWYVPYADSLRDGNGKVKLDSTGKGTPLLRWLPAYKEQMIVDFKVDMEAMIRKLNALRPPFKQP